MKHLRRWSRLAVAVSSLVGASICTTYGSMSAAHAGGFGIPEFGGRRTGMGAVIGRPDELSAVQHNPAGLILQKHGWNFYFSSGVSFVTTKLKFHTWEHSEDVLPNVPVDSEGYYPETEPTQALGAFPMLVLSRDVIPDKLVVAVSAYAANATGGFFAEDGYTRYHIISGYLVAPQATISAAYKVDPKWTLGASLGVMNLRLHFKSSVFPFTTNASGSSTDLRSLIGENAKLTLDATKTVPIGNAGVFGTPMTGLTVGASVIAKVDATLGGDISIVPSDDVCTRQQNPDPTCTGESNKFTGTATVTQFLPWSFAAGANYDVTPQVEVGTEFRFWLYSQFKTRTLTTNTAPATLIKEQISVKDFNDSYQLAGGVRVHDLPQAPGWDFMLGTHYDQTPAPSKSVSVDSPTFNHIGLHSGVRYTRGTMRYGLNYLHYWYDIPTITDSITAPPSNIKGAGSNNIVSLQVEVNFGASK